MEVHQVKDRVVIENVNFVVYSEDKTPTKQFGNIVLENGKIVEFVPSSSASTDSQRWIIPGWIDPQVKIVYF